MKVKLKRLVQILLENIEADAPDIILLDKVRNIEKYLKIKDKEKFAKAK